MSAWPMNGTSRRRVCLQGTRAEQVDVGFLVLMGGSSCVACAPSSGRRVERRGGSNPVRARLGHGPTRGAPGVLPLVAGVSGYQMVRSWRRRAMRCR